MGLLRNVTFAAIISMGSVLSGTASAEVEIKHKADPNGYGGRISYGSEFSLVFANHCRVPVRYDVDGFTTRKAATCFERSFEANVRVLSAFTRALYWKPDDRHIVTVEDIDGDGFDDIIGFGDKQVFVAKMNPNASRAEDLFYAVTSQVDGFSYETGWRLGKHQRGLYKVNDDNCLDLVGFGDRDTFVNLYDPSKCGSSRGEAVKISKAMGDPPAGSLYPRSHSAVTPMFGVFPETGGFNKDSQYCGSKPYKDNPRMPIRTVQDVNGDGCADFVGFRTGYSKGVKSPWKISGGLGETAFVVLGDGKGGSITDTSTKRPKVFQFSYGACFVVPKTKLSFEGGLPDPQRRKALEFFALVDEKENLCSSK